MKERPILFSAPMVRAILAVTKTQTRRVVKRQPPAGLDAGLLHVEGEPHPRLTHGRLITSDSCPYGQPGDRLWVRETWAAPHNCDHLKPREIDGDWRIHYAATEDRGGLLWRPSIHMPRAASRITLEVTGVRVERLQDISTADAWAEGIPGAPPPGVYVERVDEFVRWSDGVMRDNPKVAYRELWESINGPGSWDENPWIWVIGFNVL